jgi:hypothetical protein
MEYIYICTRTRHGSGRGSRGKERGGSMGWEGLRLGGSKGAGGMRVKGDVRGSYTAGQDTRGRYSATDEWMMHKKNRMRVKGEIMDKPNAPKE